MVWMGSDVALRLNALAGRHGAAEHQEAGKLSGEAAVGWATRPLRVGGGCSQVCPEHRVTWRRVLVRRLLLVATFCVHLARLTECDRCEEVPRRRVRVERVRARESGSKGGNARGPGSQPHPAITWPRAS